jgi:hypothetical protein
VREETVSGGVISAEAGFSVATLRETRVEAVD